MKVTRAEYLREFGAKTDYPRLLSSVSVAAVTAIAGSYIFAMALNNYGSPGAIALWGLGSVAGFVATRFITRGEGLAWLLATSIVLAMLLGEINWLRWNSVGSESWSLAASRLGYYFDYYRHESLVAVIFAIGGGMSAYRQARR